MKTPDQIKIELKDALPVHFHKGDPEPHLTPFNYHALECLHADALSYIQRLETQVPRWISVEERLPEKHTGVIACCEDGYITPMVHDGRHWNWNGKYEDSVTHWMPLPEPPKEE